MLLCGCRPSCLQIWQILTEVQKYFCRGSGHKESVDIASYNKRLVQHALGIENNTYICSVSFNNIDYAGTV